METAVLEIPFAHLALAFIPALAVVGILHKWSLNYGNGLYAMCRMLVQLLLVGYFLVYIFEARSALIVIAVLAVMLFASSWISLRTITARRQPLFTKALYAMAIGGGVTLLLITQGVLDLQPWYWPRYMVPLAGMIFANAMNSVSLAAERLEAEIERETPYEEARSIAFRTSLIPITNSLFAVGIVSIPGMMTGQILSGISPLMAARYQIMVMCMIFGASGISSGCFLMFVKPHTWAFVTNGEASGMGG
jgi:putative ABC transport system permease protein